MYVRLFCHLTHPFFELTVNVLLKKEPGTTHRTQMLLSFCSGVNCCFLKDANLNVKKSSTLLVLFIVVVALVFPDLNYYGIDLIVT